MIRVEFLRKSKNGRITLVLDQSASPVRSLWAIMDATDVEVAADALREREGVPKSNSKKDIGRWTRGALSPENILDLSNWAQARGVDAVVWTALGFKYDDSATPPAADEICSYLGGRLGRVREDAERYIRRTPKQIDTPYRRLIEARLGWTPKDSD